LGTSGSVRVPGGQLPGSTRRYEGIGTQGFCTLSMRGSINLYFQTTTSIPRSHIPIHCSVHCSLLFVHPFEIPRGKLFRLTIDFVATESVIYNKGQGYMLKPVLRISDTSEITGIFRGNLTVSNSLGANETLLELHTDGTARLRIASYPKYTLYADYKYNSSSKAVVLTNTELSAPGLKKRALKKIMKKIPDTISLPVKQWSPDSIIAIDTSGLTCNLYRVDGFDFSDGISHTAFTLNIDYPDATKVGKDVITVIDYLDTGMPPYIFNSVFEGSRITETVELLNGYIQGSSTRICITSYLIEDPDNMNLDIGIYASRLAILMTDTSFSESTVNPWQQPDIFTVNRNGGGQEFTIAFPPSLNIKMEHGNFTNNNPVVSWDAHPQAQNGYFVLVLVENKNRLEPEDELVSIACHEYTINTSITFNSNLVRFTPVYSTIGEIPPSIVPGDKIRVEVFVLDGSGRLNTVEKQGALLMDAATIIR